MKTRLPPVPAERAETVRGRIVEALSGGPATAKDISKAARIPEREVAGHLEHIRKSARISGKRLRVTPAQCLGCGFAFTRRERFTRPGRCPVCGGHSLSLPLFSLDEAPR